MIHQPVSRGLTVFADAWLYGWLSETSAETGSGSALEALRDNVLYKSTYFTFLSQLHSADEDTVSWLTNDGS